MPLNPACSSGIRHTRAVSSEQCRNILQRGAPQGRGGPPDPVANNRAMRCSAGARARCRVACAERAAWRRNRRSSPSSRPRPSETPRSQRSHRERSAKFQPAQRVLVNGASGGRARSTCRSRSRFEAAGTGVCGARSSDMVRSIGADWVIDYTREDTQPEEGHDAILDLIGTARSRIAGARFPYAGRTSGSARGTWLAGSGSGVRSSCSRRSSASGRVPSSSPTRRRI